MDATFEHVDLMTFVRRLWVVRGMLHLMDFGLVRLFLCGPWEDLGSLRMHALWLR